jgi:hypothetical protein
MAAGGSAAQADTFAISYEQPGVFATTKPLIYGGVETFNELSSGTQTFQSSFGTGGDITGSYTGVDITPNDQVGGVGGSGEYATIGYEESYSIDLATTKSAGLNYFGAFVTAVNPGNQIQFYKGATLVGTFDLTATIPSSITGNPAYLVNTSFYNNYEGQPFVFMNFLDVGGTFNRVVFAEPEALQYGGNFGSDNHTVGFAAVPEPATWAVIMLGFGLAGATLRRRRSPLAA